MWCSCFTVFLFLSKQALHCNVWSYLWIQSHFITSAYYSVLHVGTAAFPENVNTSIITQYRLFIKSSPSCSLKDVCEGKIASQLKKYMTRHSFGKCLFNLATISQPIKYMHTCLHITNLETVENNSNKVIMVNIYLSTLKYGSYDPVLRNYWGTYYYF